MTSKPRAPVPPPPFAAFRTTTSAQRQLAAPAPPKILSGAAAWPVPAPWPGAPVPAVMQRQRAPFAPASIQPTKLPPRPTFLPPAAVSRQPPARIGAAAMPIFSRPQRVVQRAAGSAAAATAASADADLERRRNGIARISAVLKLIYSELYPAGMLTLPKEITSPDKLLRYIYNRLSLEAGNPYFQAELPSLGILLSSDQKSYFVHKQVDDEKKKKKKEDKAAAAAGTAVAVVPVTDADLSATSYYFVDNINYARRGQSRRGVARRIVVNLLSQAEGMKLATMFIGLFKALAPPATAAATTAAAAYPASPRANALKGGDADFARYISQFKVYLGNEHAKKPEPEKVGIKRDKLVIYYDYVAGPAGVDTVGNGIVDAITAAGVKPLRNLAPFYATIAPGIAWAEEPKHFSTDEIMQQSYTKTRASVIQDVILANPKIPNFTRFVQLVVMMFRACGIDINRVHRHA